MTLIQPNTNKSILGMIIGAASVIFLTAVIVLIIVYNQTVDLRHGIAQVKDDLQKTQTENAELKDKVFTIIGAASLENFAQGRNLVKEKQPHYLEVAQRQ